jgi:GNAT superfamily N-acetyltransferase
VGQHDCLPRRRPMQIDRLKLADLPAALRLSTQAGWNQLDADWRRLIDLWPDGCFAGRVDGELVATATLASYGNVGWVGMVLVDEACRGQGFGGAIMDHVIADADRRGIQNLGLDASDMGRPVYLKRGFADAGGIDRRMLAADERVAAKQAADRVYDADWDSLLALDRAGCGWDRSALLAHLRREPGVRCEVVRDGGVVTAFGFRRPGRTAEHIGPVVGNPAAAQVVIESLASPTGNADVVIDTFRRRGGAPWLDRRGFAVTRQLTRMWRGRPSDAKDVIAASGFELG